MDDRMPAPSAFEEQPSSLLCLNSLTLNYGKDVMASWSIPNIDLQIMNQSSKSYYSIIGKYCPALSNLKVNGYCMKKKDVLGLIVGDLANILFSYDGEEFNESGRWLKDPLLVDLRVPAEFLSPICFSLEHLDLQTNRPCEHAFTNRHSEWAFAFALRHLPKLESISILNYRDRETFAFHTVDHVQSIKLLYNGNYSSKPGNEILFKLRDQPEFVEACQQLPLPASVSNKIQLLRPSCVTVTISFCIYKLVLLLLFCLLIYSRYAFNRFAKKCQD